jgi:rubrerythrin
MAWIGELRVRLIVDPQGILGDGTMDARFGVFEILKISEEVERKAARFYMGLSERFADDQRSETCRELADWHARHERMWGRIRDAYSRVSGDFGILDANDYVLSNPQVMAALTGFGLHCDVATRLDERRDARQVMTDAIKRAEDVIVFYQGLKAFACDQAGRMMIENAIAEEERHIRHLGRLREDVRSLKRSAHIWPTASANAVGVF